MCRVAILVSTETAAKDALLLTSAKSHPTQFCFSSRLQWTSRFYVEAQLDFRTLLFVPRRAPVVLFESTRPRCDFRVPYDLRCLACRCDAPPSGGRVHGRFLACLHCVMNSSRLRFPLFSDGMLCNSCYGRGVCAVECVTAHVCCIQEDLGAEAVFCIDGWSTALGNTTVYVGVTIFAKRLDFLSVSCGSDGNLSYTSVSRAQISSEVRHYCVSDGTYCSADVCCAKSLFPPFKSNTKCDVIIRKHLSQNDVLSSGAHDEGHDGVSSVHADDHGGCSTKRFHCAEVLPT